MKSYMSFLHLHHPHIINTIYTYAFSSVIFHGLNKLLYGSPRLTCTYIHTYFFFFFNFITYLRMFSGGDLWARDEQARDLSDVWKTTTEKKGCITFALALVGLMRSAVNPTIDQLPHRAVFIYPIFRYLWPGFCFGMSFFHGHWGLLTMRC